jgi:hypothetical protein
MFLFPSSYLDISQVSYFIRRFVEEKNLAAMCQSALHIPCQFNSMQDSVKDTEMMQNQFCPQYPNEKEKAGYNHLSHKREYNVTFFISSPLV